MEGGKKRLATLVGCNYPNTPHELHGCINDVHAMRDLLVSRFCFQPEDIVLCTDAPGSPVLPNRANILSTLRGMVERAEAGDVLFFHFSGHGTRIKMPAGDGDHQAIVTCDFNNITDVDFRELVDCLSEGVSFTIVADSCFSGGLIGKEKEQIGPSTIVKSESSSARWRNRFIPHEELLQHLASLSGIDSQNVGDHLLQLFGLDVSPKYLEPHRAAKAIPPDVGILLSASQPNEVSADMPIAGTYYGAFSYSIQMVMKGHEGVVSNRVLVMLSRDMLKELQKSGDMKQHPCLYCSDDNSDAPFLWDPVKKHT